MVIETIKSCPQPGFQSHRSLFLPRAHALLWPTSPANSAENPPVCDFMPWLVFPCLLPPSKVYSHFTISLGAHPGSCPQSFCFGLIALVTGTHGMLLGWGFQIYSFACTTTLRSPQVQGLRLGLLLLSSTSPSQGASTCLCLIDLSCVNELIPK